MRFGLYYVTAHLAHLSTALPAIPAAVSEEMGPVIIGTEAAALPQEAGPVLGMSIETAVQQQAKWYHPTHIPIPLRPFVPLPTPAAATVQNIHHVPTPAAFTLQNIRNVPAHLNDPGWPLPLPWTCYTAFPSEGPRQTLGLPECYTHTNIAPAETCAPLTTCQPRPSDLICPLYIKVSKTTIPCQTNCCPLTSTVTSASGPCPTCDPCRIPTEMITYLTGCPGTDTVTHVATITPAF